MRSIWGIRYIKRKIQERAAKKKEETAADKAARITAAATKWMAIFTFILVLVTLGTLLVLRSQLREMQSGGKDTHDLADAAGKQQEATGNIAEASKQQAAATKSLADNAIAQAKAANELAAQAKVSADAARRLADTDVRQLEVAQRPWLVIEIERTGTIFSNDKEAVIKIPVTITNTGQTPATETYFRNEFFVKPVAGGPLKEARRLCKEAADETTEPFGAGETIFPNHHIRMTWEIHSVPKSMDGLKSGDHLAPIVMFCVGYHPTFKDAKYYTGIAYDIGGVKAGQTYPLQNLDFFPLALGLLGSTIIQ
jgi:hypothetical protein